MSETLDRTQRRIIGVLIEKQLSTPDQYPLTLNALQLGCNQKSNREPVMSLETFEIEGTLRSLQLEGWILQRSREGGRTDRWGHRADEKLGLGKPELAVLSVLFLRGPQTLNELKTRTERLHPFTGADAVAATLKAMAERSLVRELLRARGERAERWEHRFTPASEAPSGPEASSSGEETPRHAIPSPSQLPSSQAVAPASETDAGEPPPSTAGPARAEQLSSQAAAPDPDANFASVSPDLVLRVEALETEMDTLKEELADLRQRLDESDSGV